LPTQPTNSRASQDPFAVALALYPTCRAGFNILKYDLRLLAAHGGGYLPTYLGRSDHGWLTRPDVRGCARRPSEYLSELYVDSLVYRPADLRALVAATGAEHVLLGSDYPFDMGVPDPVARLAEADLKPPQAAAIAGGNARRLRLTPQREGEAR